MNLEQLEAENAALRSRAEELRRQIAGLRICEENELLRCEISASRLRRLVAVCANEYGVTVQRVLSRDKTAAACHARQVVLVLLRESGLTLQAAGALLKRDHGTVTHAEGAVARMMEWPMERERITRIRATLGALDLVPSKRLDPGQLLFDSLLRAEVVNHEGTKGTKEWGSRDLVPPGRKEDE